MHASMHVAARIIINLQKFLENNMHSFCNGPLHDDAAFCGIMESALCTVACDEPIYALEEVHSDTCRCVLVPRTIANIEPSKFSAACGAVAL